MVGPRRTASAPRKQPRREESTQIVDAILSAASLLLERDGLDGLTTNAVARVAGVSVGSLYQYFSDKTAIVTEIARRVQTTALALLAQESIALSNATSREAIARVAALSCSPGFGTNEVRRALLNEVPRGWILDETRVADGAIQTALVAYFGARPDEMRPLALTPAVFVVQHAVEGVPEEVLFARPEALPGIAVQRELFHLAWAYVVRDGGPIERPPFEERDLPPPLDTPAEEIARRLLTEPSHRRVERARAAQPSERARATRLAIVDAAERVLERDGYSGLSVRMIAREANIATGSLYSHFAGPQAVVAEVAARIEGRHAADLASRLERAHGPRAIAEAMAAAYAHDRSRSLRRTVLLEVPRRWIEDIATPAAIAHVAAALAAEGDAIRAGDRELMAFFALHAVRTVSDAYLTLEPDSITMADIERELTELVARYLA